MKHQYPEGSSCGSIAVMELSKLMRKKPATTWMAWERIEPDINRVTGEVTRDAWWKCTKSTTLSRADAENWAKMPISDQGRIPVWAVVEVLSDTSQALRDRAIPDECFVTSVIVHDLTGSEKSNG